MLILADDLTGASDCAIAAAASGLSATVAFGDLPHDLPAHIIAIDCDCRHLPAHAAAAATIELLRRYDPGPGCLIFKKVDSTLRGNVAAEVAALLASRRSAKPGSRVVAVMAPAFPTRGRTTVGGQQLVHGTPLHLSETWRHEQASAPTDLPSLLASAGLRSAVLDLASVRHGVDSLARAMQEQAAIADVLVCDAELDIDLRAIAQASLALGRDTLWVGSAGLARHLPGADPTMPTSSPAPASFQLAHGPSLFVIGSRSTVARAQVQELAQQPATELLTISPATLLSDPLSADYAVISLELRRALLTGRDLVVTLAPGTAPDGSLDQRLGRRLTVALATLVQPAADVAGALVACGGETARAILDQWGVCGLRLFGELEAGLPIAVTEGWHRPLPVLTKAGAFGDPQTLVRCLAFLRSLERHARTNSPSTEAHA